MTLSGATRYDQDGVMIPLFFGEPPLRLIGQAIISSLHFLFAFHHTSYIHFWFYALTKLLNFVSLFQTPTLPLKKKITLAPLCIVAFLSCSNYAHCIHLHYTPSVISRPIHNAMRKTSQAVSGCNGQHMKWGRSKYLARFVWLRWRLIFWVWWVFGGLYWWIEGPGWLWSTAQHRTGFDPKCMDDDVFTG